MPSGDRINVLSPEGINNKRAHLGGIARLAAAAFLVGDAHMPAANITVYAARPCVGSHRAWHVDLV